jgi:acyl-coenzyme A thioesterase 9
MGGRFAAKNAALTEFVAAEERTVFEHYMKVIPRKYVPLDEGDAMRVYEYTFNSNQFSVEKTRQKDMFELYEPVDDVGLPEGPMVKFAYDISGMEVITREHRKNFLEWVLGCCAILGGVYTCAAIAESVVFASAKHLVKRRLRKQS